MSWRVDVFGNGDLSGFVFYDQMEYDAIPAPGAMLLLAGLPLVNSRRRR